MVAGASAVQVELNVTVCTPISGAVCNSVAEHNSDDTGVGSTIGKADAVELDWSNVPTSAIISQINLTLRHDGNAGIGGAWTITFEDSGGTSLGCSDNTISHVATDTTDTWVNACNSLTAAQLNDMQLDFLSGDDKGSTDAFITYVELDVIYEIPPTVTTLLQGPATAAVPDSVTFTVNATDDSGTYNMIVCMEDNVSAGSCNTGTVCRNNSVTSGVQGVCINSSYQTSYENFSQVLKYNGTDSGESLDGPRELFILGDHALTVHQTPDVFSVWNWSNGLLNFSYSNGSRLGAIGGNTMFVSPDRTKMIILGDTVQDNILFYDISNPAYVRYTGNLSDTGAGGTLDQFNTRINADFSPDSNLVYVAADDALHIFNISDIDSFERIAVINDSEVGGSLTKAQSAYDVEAVENYVYISSDADNGFSVVNVTDPYNPVEVDSITNTVGNSIESYEDILIMWDSALTPTDGVYIYNTSNKAAVTTSPKLISNMNLPNTVRDSLSVNDYRMYFFESNNPAWIVYDVSDWNSPVLLVNYSNDDSGYPSDTDIYQGLLTTYVTATEDLVVFDVNQSTFWSVGYVCDSGNLCERAGSVRTEISTTDTTAPVISNVANTSITNSSVLITWNTDDSANSSVEYGTTTDLLGGSNSSASLTTSHSLSIYGLTNNTLYHYNVTSCNSDDLCNTSGPYNFTTLDNTGDSCSDFEGGSTYEIDCADACTIDAATDAGGQSINFSGVGEITVTAAVTNWEYVQVSSACYVTVSGGGYFG